MQPPRTSRVDPDDREQFRRAGRRPPWIAALLGFSLRTYNSLNKRAARRLLPRLVVRPPKAIRYSTLGVGEGAWAVPADLIRPDWVAYCVGVGTNATFDQALARDCGALVVSIDPTPIAIRYMESLPRDRTRHLYVPVGVWSRDTTLRFFAPMGSQSVNLSARDIHATGRFVEVPVKTLRTIMTEQNHDRIDLLKIDIEGSWFEIVKYLHESRLKVSVLCAEFDTPTSPLKAWRAIRLLDAVGLKLVHADRENLVFVQGALLAP